MGRAALLILLAGALLGGCNRIEVDYPQFVKDLHMAYTITMGFGDINKNDVSVLPAGPADLNVDCPLGGKTHITGTINSTSSSINYSLSHDLADCGLALTLTSGTFEAHLTGKLTDTSALTVPDGYGTEEFQSDSLKITGSTVFESFTADWDDTCKFDMFVVSSDVSDAIRGSICDRPVGASLNYKPQ